MTGFPHDSGFMGVARVEPPTPEDTIRRLHEGLLDTLLNMKPGDKIILERHHDLIGAPVMTLVVREYTPVMVD